MPIEAGKRYIFVNKKSGTALDLDTRDNRSVQGWARHGGPNQQWEAVSVDRSNWQFKNVHQGGHLGRKGLEDGERIICDSGTYSWAMDRVPTSGENVYRIVVSGATKKCVDLADGSTANGTPVQIWTSSITKKDSRSYTNRSVDNVSKVRYLYQTFA